MNPKQCFQSIYKYDLSENHYKQCIPVICNQMFIRVIKRDDKKYLISNVISFIWHLNLKINMQLLIKIVVIENVTCYLEISFPISSPRFCKFSMCDCKRSILGLMSDLKFPSNDLISPPIELPNSALSFLI